MCKNAFASIVSLSKVLEFVYSIPDFNFNFLFVFFVSVFFFFKVKLQIETASIKIELKDGFSVERHK